MHPNSIEGGVEETVLRFIVRDFDAGALDAHEALLQRLADEVAATEPRARITVEVGRSYRNMKEYLTPTRGPSTAAESAVRRAGLTPRRAYIRGGTDGVAAERAGAAHAQPVHRGARLPQRAGVDQRAGHGRRDGDADPPGPGVGRVKTRT